MTIEERLNRIEKKLNLDEIDQPRPEPGTVVWCIWFLDDEPVNHLFLREDDALGYIKSNPHLRGGIVVPLLLPARILADNEVAVEKNELANLRYFVNNPSAWDDGFSQNVSDAIERLITRTEAERLEAEG